MQGNCAVGTIPLLKEEPISGGADFNRDPNRGILVGLLKCRHDMFESPLKDSLAENHLPPSGLAGLARGLIALAKSPEVRELRARLRGDDAVILLSNPWLVASRDQGGSDAPSGRHREWQRIRALGISAKGLRIVETELLDWSPDTHEQAKRWLAEIAGKRWLNVVASRDRFRHAPLPTIHNILHLRELREVSSLRQIEQRVEECADAARRFPDQFLCSMPLPRRHYTQRQLAVLDRVQAALQAKELPALEVISGLQGQRRWYRAIAMQIGGGTATIGVPSRQSGDAVLHFENETPIEGQIVTLLYNAVFRRYIDEEKSRLNDALKDFPASDFSEVTDPALEGMDATGHPFVVTGRFRGYEFKVTRRGNSDLICYFGQESTTALPPQERWHVAAPGLFNRLLQAYGVEPDERGYGYPRIYSVAQLRGMEGRNYFLCEFDADGNRRAAGFGRIHSIDKDARNLLSRHYNPETRREELFRIDAEDLLPSPASGGAGQSRYAFYLATPDPESDLIERLSSQRRQSGSDGPGNGINEG